jgi:hypothetical protein
MTVFTISLSFQALYNLFVTFILLILLFTIELLTNEKIKRTRATQKTHVKSFNHPIKIASGHRACKITETFKSQKRRIAASGTAALQY